MQTAANAAANINILFIMLFLWLIPLVQRCEPLRRCQG